MVITKLMGGLSNQMFQYAIGRSLACKNQAELKLDISWFDNHTKRKYGLLAFNIIEGFASQNEVAKFKKKGIGKLIERFKPYYKRSIVRERYYSNKNMSKISNNVYLEGYWQNEKYFKDAEGIIRKEFTLKNKLKNFNNTLKQKITNVNSVSLHIRRTDYVTTKKHVFWQCPLSYYYMAIKKIAENYNNLYIFVFSDDIEWAKDNLKINFPVNFIEGNKDYQDLTLMSLCKHNVIANSSFSWWGAWLNNNPNKIVVAPKKWFKGQGRNTKDLIPKQWIKM